MHVIDNLSLAARRWRDELDALGWRGLALVHGRSYTPIALDALARGESIVVASRGRRGFWEDMGLRVESPARIHRLLGREFDTVVLDVEPLLMPNLLAAVAETVRAPGVVLVVADCPVYWDPGGGEGTGGYRRYLERVLPSMEALLRLDACSNRVIEYRLPQRRAPRPWPPGVEGLEDRDYIMLPRVLRSLVATRDQAEALVAAYRFARGGYRSFFLTGDRGRGKSAALGLILALFVIRRDVGVVTLTSPAPENVQTVFNFLTRALDSANIRYRLVKRGELVLGIRGAWFHVRYHTPDSLYEPGPLLAIDEAAAIGVHRLRMLARKARRVLAVGTVHGYEGSGRTLIHLVERVLPSPILRVELSTPVRYPPHDPLEEWLYDVFVLRRLDDGRVEASRGLECRRYDGWSLASDPDRVKSVYSILAEAHYRNEPDDLAIMLDLPYYLVYALEANGSPVAVAEVSLEWLAPVHRRMLTGLAGLEGWRVARVARIAVAPGLQRRGYGSRLLRCIEDDIGADYIGAVYSRSDVTRFWLRNKYRVVYISPRFNRMTGEKNIVVLKSIGGPLHLLAEAERRARTRLVLAGQAVYRDLPAEVVAEMLSIEPLIVSRLPLGLEDWQARDLEEFIRGYADHEAVWHAVWPVVASILVSRSMGLEGRAGIAVVARLVQGKPLSEVAAITGMGREEVFRLIENSLRVLLERVGLVWV